jgi:hypothetical protein
MGFRRQCQYRTDRPEAHFEIIVKNLIILWKTMPSTTFVAISPLRNRGQIRIRRQSGMSRSQFLTMQGRSGAYLRETGRLVAAVIGRDTYGAS